jgi:hypothetical protein
MLLMLMVGPGAVVEESHWISDGAAATEAGEGEKRRYLLFFTAAT